MAFYVRTLSVELTTFAKYSKDETPIYHKPYQFCYQIWWGAADGVYGCVGGGGGIFGERRVVKVFKLEILMKVAERIRNACLKMDEHMARLG